VKSRTATEDYLPSAFGGPADGCEQLPRHIAMRPEAPSRPADSPGQVVFSKPPEHLRS
jgi:hypothetical protein